jgi:hypothetical protein
MPNHLPRFLQGCPSFLSAPVQEGGNGMGGGGEVQAEVSQPTRLLRP